MDKYEYKIRVEEIKALITQAEYIQAAEIADSIDWRRVKSVMMLCTISDLYKINRRYEDARDMLLLAYDRHPSGRTIVYSLCELSIKMEDVVQAVEYYKEYKQIAPRDTGHYILQYKLYEAQDVSLEERIAVLEELKEKDYREKWAYELAYLYHRIGLSSNCVEECNDLILWFGEGKYVIKAMELKMLHEPLTSEQMAKYENRFEGNSSEEKLPHDNQEEYYENNEVETGNYADTNNYGDTVNYGDTGNYADTANYTDTDNYGVADNYYTDAYNYADNEMLNAPTSRIPSDDIEIKVKTMDVGMYNTINLQKELAEGLREVLGEQEPVSHENITRSIVAPMLDTDTESLDFPQMYEEDELADEFAEEIQDSEVFFGETEDISSIQESIHAVSNDTGEIVMEQLRQETLGIVSAIEPPKSMANVLSMESDGQISLVMPELDQVEKQITGQLSIQDILAEWERMKKENEEKRKEDVRQRVMQQTGTMFTDFEASVRDGLLEQLENKKNAEAASTLDTPEDVVTEDTQETTEEAVMEYTQETTEELDEVEELEEVSQEELEEVEGIEEAAEISESPEIADSNETIEYEELEEEPQEELQQLDEVEELEEIQEVEEIQDAEEIDETIHYEALDEKAIFEEPEELDEIEEPEKTEVLEEQKAVDENQPSVRSFTKEQKELFAPFVQNKSGREQLINALDKISLAAYTGNVIVTGEEGMDTLTLAKNMISEIQMTDNNFSGKVAKISGASLNGKQVPDIVDQLKNGALIIQGASSMNDSTAKALYNCLQQETLGIIVVLEGTKKSINKFLDKYTKLSNCFNARMDMEALSDNSLVSFGEKYAKEREFALDEFGRLALHEKIDDMQTINHVVTTMDVKEMVDNAIYNASRKTLGHFIDVLFAKRYDDTDMIIIREKDFR